MNRLLTVALLILVPFAAAAVGDSDQQLAASRAAAKSFGTDLKRELQAALQAGGAINGITVCNDKAAAIADATSERLALDIGRTSLKVRNPDNAADDWERAVLNGFEARKARGEAVASLEHYEVLESDGERTFRYMKAIPTAKVCLTCHGTELSPELRSKLDALYPNDEARGFREGDIRGAFTVAKPL